GVYPHK
nr:peptidyl-dipeptidase A inhibitory peptide C111 - striped bonito [Sarda orientalis]